MKAFFRGLLLSVVASLSFFVGPVVAQAEACDRTYKLEDGLSYYKVPVAKLDGHVDYIDVEVGPMTYFYCDETAIDEGIVMMSCAVMDDRGMAGMTTFPYQVEGAAPVDDTPHKRKPRLGLDEAMRSPS